MAFCPKCGKIIPEGSNVEFCSGCGSRVQGNVAPQTTDKKTNQIDAKEILEKGKEFASNAVETVKNIDVKEVITEVKSGNKKVIGILAGSVVALIAIVVLIVSLLGGGYMSPINKYVKLMNKKSTDYYKIQAALSGSKLSKAEKKIEKAFIAADADMYGKSADEYYEDREEEYAEELEEMYDAILDEYDKYKLSFEKKKAKKMDKDDLKDATKSANKYYEDVVEDYEDMLDDDDKLEDFADQYDIDEKDAKKIIKAKMAKAKLFATGKFTAGYEVKGKFVVKVDGKDEYKTETVTLNIVKFNGNWIYAGCDGSLYFDTDGDEEAAVLQYLLEYFSAGMGLY